MTVIQAALLALFCYLGALTTPWVLGTSGGWYVISRPLVAGLLCGLVLGDVKTGVLIGIAVQTVYIGLITPGGAVPIDLSLVCYLGIPLAMVAYHLQPPRLSLFLSALASSVSAAWQLLSVGNAGWAHLGDRYAEEGNLNGIIRINYLAQIGTFILRFILPFAVLYFGAGVAQNLIGSHPKHCLGSRAISTLRCARRRAASHRYRYLDGADHQHHPDADVVRAGLGDGCFPEAQPGLGGYFWRHHRHRFLPLLL